jgi:hypothetical protein
MAHVKGRAKKLWTGLLPPGVAEGSEGDSRICWHVVTAWEFADQFGKDLTRLGEMETNEGASLKDLSGEQQAEAWRIITRYVVGWSNYLGSDGAPVPFTWQEFLQVDVGHVGELFEQLPLAGASVQIA